MGDSNKRIVPTRFADIYVRILPVIDTNRTSRLKPSPANKGAIKLGQYLLKCETAIRKGERVYSPRSESRIADDSNKWSDRMTMFVVYWLTV